jgi:spoIIIJ-associated protein
VDSQLSLGKKWLDQLLALMNLTATVNTEGLEIDGESNCWLNIDGSGLTSNQKQQFIGDKGEGIDAIQYLANTILNLDAVSESPNSFVVELDGYRLKRNQELATLTTEAIEQVRSTGEETEISGLSSAERKQIHSLLEDTVDLKSESRGQEPDRRLIIRPQSSEA